ncbi:MAG: DNA polymerase III subunit gamma/tau [Candidatus Magasanikbacteria bacterium]|jgi:DNA polymerase III subunit gamma/tau|nr:DNA polymerase III subunit gamma/tau [Candidatus Magasanikbacteria bacterium]MBT4350389.1 DNA polymerase III subunit gamma/tau [Candidatus Magasanikbacteria bacterium]MBT4542064.1 DNA polymerase III subunit gamma/tau [Candidatus Magasanikbacteria bacterium]MBT6253576.1 DNA polymerase III subunit gamma/tau [Candidatus Magasanikbacteria bacterium]
MALYHTYRPQIFADVTGQSHIITTITNQLAKGSVAHAYLFSGPRGIGKTTTARLLAKALNCTSRKEGTFEPCNTCQSCIETTAGRALDVIEIDAASHTGVDHVREHIIDNAQFRPTSSTYKVFIIDEVHMLSTSAFNALLKTLEEPPSHVVFILATTELHKLPATIISRCQRFSFTNIPFDVLKERLLFITKKERVTVDEAVLLRIIQKSDGCARDAVTLLDQVMATGETHITADVASLVLPTAQSEEAITFITHLINKDTTGALSILATLTSAGVHMHQFSHDLIELLRFLLISKTGANTAHVGLDLHDEHKKRLLTLCETITYSDLVSLIDMALQRKEKISKSPISSLPLELLVVEWASMGAPTTTPASPLPTPPQVTPPPTSPPVSSPPTPQEPPMPTQKEPSSQEEKTVIEETPPTASPASSGDAVCTIEKVKSMWSACVSKVESSSPSLVFILKMADVVSVESNIITLRVAYGFHKDKLLANTPKKLIEKSISDVLGSKMTFSVLVDVDTEAAVIKPSQELKDLAAAFGGEVVG